MQTYNDSAGLSLTEALHPGVLRYPSGTGSNIWDTIKGQFIPAPAGNPGGYHGWETELAPPVNGAENDLFWRQVYTENDHILPRQARGTHAQSLRKQGRFLQDCLLARSQGHRFWPALGARQSA